MEYLSDRTHHPDHTLNVPTQTYDLEGPLDRSVQCSGSLGYEGVGSLSQDARSKGKIRSGLRTISSRVGVPL